MAASSSFSERVFAYSEGKESERFPKLEREFLDQNDPERLLRARVNRFVNARSKPFPTDLLDNLLGNKNRLTLELINF